MSQMYASGTAKGSDVPIAHLDYPYIGKCTDEKQLEKIIEILRSGAEGYYPKLVEFAENKLRELNPKSHVLRKDNPVKDYKSLDKETQQEVCDELKNWTSQMRDMDDKLKTSNTTTNHSLPPVRATQTFCNSKKSDKPASVQTTKKNIKPREYHEWDKFDIDKELSNIDKEETRPEAKPQATKNKPTFPTKTTLPKDLNKEERSLRAVKEKDKGNEAFKACDYEEAIAYYSNSLNYETLPASYNNRAAAELKLERYHEAIQDCNMVLKLEQSNLKAHLRRGLAHKALKMYKLAIDDFNSMLKLDPDNKRAKELLGEIENAQRETPVMGAGNPETKTTKKSGQRMKIIEIEDSDDDSMQDNIAKETRTQENTKAKKGKRVKIKDIESNVVENASKMAECDSKNESSNHCHTTGTCNETNDATKNHDNITNIPARNDQTCGDVTDENTKVVQEPSPASTNTPSNTPTADANVSCDTTNTGNLTTGKTTAPDSSSTKDHVVDCVPKQHAPLKLPDDVQVIVKEAGRQYKAGSYGEACQNFTEAIELLWQERDSYKNAVSSLLSNKAACCFKMGDSKECIKQCDISLEIIEDNIRVLTWRGLAYESLEKYAEAFHDFNRIRLLDSSHKVAQDHCSRVIKHLEMLYGRTWRSKIFELNKDKPNQTFPMTHKSVPDAPPLDNSEAKSTAVQSNTTAKQSQRKEHKPGKTKQEEFLIVKEKGNSLVKQGKHSEAIECYTNCIHLCPNEVAVYTNRALCYLQLTKYKEAEDDCTTALKIQETNIKALFRRAKARKGLKKYRESSGDLVALLKLDSKNTSAKTELTEVLQLLKKETKEPKKSSVPKRKKIQITDIEDDTPLMTPNEVQTKNIEDRTCETTFEKKPNETKMTSATEVKVSADNKPTTPVKYNVKTAFQFVQAWKNVKKQDISGYLNLLKQINITNLPKLITNTLDDMLSTIISSLHLELNSKEPDLLFVYNFLEKLQNVNRFDMILLLQSRKEKQVLVTVFDQMSDQNTNNTLIDYKNLTELRKKYCS